MKVILITLLFYSANSLSKSKPMCDFFLKKTKTCVNVNFLDGISRKSDSKFELEFLSDSKPIKLDQLPKSKLWMVMKNGHEHGSEEVSIKINGTKYLNENVWFLMMGEWKVIVDTKYQGKNEQFTFPVCVKRKKDKSYVGKCI